MMLPPELNSPLLCSLQFPTSTSAPAQSLRAFNCVSVAENAAISMFNKSGGKDMVAKENIVASRILGCLLYVLHQRPTSITEHATDAIRRQILNVRTQNRDSLIYEVGAMYRDHLLLAVRKITPEGPQISQSSSPRSFDTIEEKLRKDLVSASLDFETARKKALARDGYRCKLTLAWKASSCLEIRELAKEANASGTGWGAVYVCHIVNEQHIDGRRPASFLRILETFGMGDIANILAQPNGQGAHSLANLLCLHAGVQYDFDDLGVWFEPTDKEHEYTVHTGYSIAEAYRHWQETVTFNSVFPHRYEAFRATELALPDPKLLTLHGICARVANMSGAVRYFDEIDWDMEELTVLASDGSTSTAFFQSVLAPYTT